MKLIPLGDRVLVEEKEAPDISPGGVLLPETSKSNDSRFAQGNVVELSNYEKTRLSSFGIDSKDYSKNYSVGSLVYFDKFKSFPVKFEGKQYWVVPYKRIIAIVSA